MYDFLLFFGIFGFVLFGFVAIVGYIATRDGGNDLLVVDASVACVLFMVWIAALVISHLLDYGTVFNS